MTGQFLGEVKPLYGRWHWPYTFMQPGDWFIVDQALRNGEAVRQHATVRAAQLGIFLSTTVSDPKHPGFTRVTRRPLEESKADGVLLIYGKAGEKLRTWYGFNIDELPFGQLYHGRKARVDVEQSQVPSVKRMMVDIPGSGRVGFVFDPAGFDVLVLREHETFESWKEELKLEDIMD